MTKSDDHVDRAVEVRVDATMAAYEKGGIDAAVRVVDAFAQQGFGYEGPEERRAPMFVP